MGTYSLLLCSPLCVPSPPGNEENDSLVNRLDSCEFALCESDESILRGLINFVLSTVLNIVCSQKPVIWTSKPTI